jgi:enoyl-CoA hydratase/carnithine racemase
MTLILVVAAQAHLLELSLSRGSVLARLPEVEAAVASSRDGAVSGILLSIDAAEDCGQEDTRHIDALSSKARVDLLRRESACRWNLRDASVPVIAIAHGGLTGAAGALFLAASHRICTEQTVYSLDACQRGLCPSFGAIAAMAALPQPHVALAAALGAVPLDVHDCMQLGLGTHYAPKAQLAGLREDLRCSPSDFLHIPLSRRTQTSPIAEAFAAFEAAASAAKAVGLPPPPQPSPAICFEVPPRPRLAATYASEPNSPVNLALLEAFGPTAASMADAQSRLRRVREIAAGHALALTNEPCGIHVGTLDRARTHRDILIAASEALQPSRSSSTALAATFDALRRARREGMDRMSRSVQIDRDRELEIDLALDTATHSATAFPQSG